MMVNRADEAGEAGEEFERRATPRPSRASGGESLRRRRRRGLSRPGWRSAMPGRAATCRADRHPVGPAGRRSRQPRRGRYAGTRHNVGAEVAVELLRRRHGERSRLEGRSSALVAEVRIGAQRVALAFPTTYMNDSGQAVAPLMRRYGIDDPRAAGGGARRARPRAGTAEDQGRRGTGRPQRSAVDRRPPPHAGLRADPHRVSASRRVGPSEAPTTCWPGRRSAADRAAT